LACIYYTVERKLVKFDEAYGELLPFADEWRSIGILMDVPLHTIEKMGVEQTDTTSSILCLAKVLKKEAFLPTRKKFNDIVEKIKAKAKKTH
jgi:hypothetical protein